MVIAQYFEGVNLKLVKEQILFSIVVDFEGFLESNMTNQMERLIRNFKKNEVFNFLNISPAHLYKEDVICFYKEAEVGEYHITSNIFGQPILIDIHTIARAFDMEENRRIERKMLQTAQPGHEPAQSDPLSRPCVSQFTKRTKFRKYTTRLSTRPFSPVSSVVSSENANGPDFPKEQTVHNPVHFVRFLPRVDTNQAYQLFQ
ncbi:hypothetical protein OROGR_016700 [Orobanche gracilis]